MSTYTSEPGTRLADRYRLEDQVGGGGGWTLWKAIDEILARAVTVLMFTADFPRISEAVMAARAAGRLSDSRLSQVFDVDDSGDCTYVVMEWVAGDSLRDMLATGPLDTARAAGLIAEAARALAVAHAAGMSHLRLDPGCLRWTPGGGVKITGLGVDAVLAGTTADETASADPALADTRDLARLLYAALTGYWPGPEGTGLPAAPVLDGAPCSPRQVSAAVPVSVDSVTCRALFQRAGRGGTAISTPLAFADALSRIAPPQPPLLPLAVPQFAGTARILPAGAPGGDAPPGSLPVAWGPPAAGGSHRGAGRRRRGAGSFPRRAGFRALICVVALLVLAAIGATAWTAVHISAHSAHHQAAGHPGRSQPSTTASVVLKPVSAIGFDNNGDAKYAVDGSPSTDWYTQYYIGSPAFGGLKKGTGLLLDMGTQVRLSQVRVQLGPVCCAHVQLEVGNDGTGSALGTFNTVATSDSAAGNYTFHVNSHAKGRYVLIWFSRLPAMQGSANRYQGQIYNIVMRGSG